jgi:hypothetical protein
MTAIAMSVIEKLSLGAQRSALKIIVSFYPAVRSHRISR